MSDASIGRPAGWITETAIAYGDAQGAQLVDAAHPLPVTLIPSAGPAPSALTGSASTSQTVGPFAAVAGKAINLAVSGTWTGRVQLLRSTDGGTTRLPLTPAGAPIGILTGNGIDQPWVETEDNASFYLAVAVTSGSLAYRVSQ